MKFLGLRRAKYISSYVWWSFLNITLHKQENSIALKLEIIRVPKNVNYFSLTYTEFSGPSSSVSIATGYRLDGPGIESRWGARFSAPVQTGPRTNLVSCTTGTGPVPGVANGRGVTLTPHPFWCRGVKTE
jgi:hypothetical protein